MANPSDYQTYLDRINGSGFDSIKNMPQKGPYYNKYIWEIYPPDLSSYFKRTHGAGGTSNVAWISAPITTVNISGDGNTYSLSYIFNSQNTWNIIQGPSSITPTNNALLWNDGTVSVYDPVQPWTLTIDGTLEQIFTDLANNAKNINIYVDGVFWSGPTPPPAITSNGGGATHIAKVTGQLSSLSNNLSDILMVSGGGGGGLLVGDGGAKSSCVRDTADELIIGITSQIDYIRNFKKKTNSEALCVLYYDSESEYYGPIIISKGNKENAKYWFNDWGTYYESVDGGSALVNGETWFISSPNLWLHYPDTNPSGFDLPILTGLESSKYLDYIYEESEIAGIIQRILNLTTDTHIGKEAGGISGSPTNSGNQSTGYAFGQGESDEGVSGGGGGLYGGYKGSLDDSGGAGSGYIGNASLGNKKMVGYNVPTSSAESTKTESVNEASESPVSGKPKIGNGYAKIKFLRPCWGGEEVTILWAGDSNKMTVQISNSDILFKLYTGDTVIYSFTAYAGSTVLDADNIYVHFLIESEQQLAKPSMVYANGSVLSYNQESPTDEEMADIYTWLSAGLPSA